MGVMKYFTPETSKKLEEMGLEAQRIEFVPDYKMPTDLQNGSIIHKVEGENAYWAFSTLDICELENARKLFGEAGIYSKIAHYPDSVYEANPIPKMYEVGLRDYITLTDEERVEYVEDYLATL
jgi:hypothetical protein